MSNLQYTAISIRDASILTNSYVASTILGDTEQNRIQELNQCVLLIDFTIWSLTSLELKIEYSDDNISFYQDTFLDISWGTATASLGEYTFEASGAYNIAVPFKARVIRASVIWTWTVTWSSCAIKWILWMV